MLNKLYLLIVIIYIGIINTLVMSSSWGKPNILLLFIILNKKEYNFIYVSYVHSNTIIQYYKYHAVFSLVLSAMCNKLFYY